MLADFDPQVVSIAAQPLQLTGPDGDRVRRHVPDCCWWIMLALTTVDVKAPYKRDDPQVRALMGWTREVVSLCGWAFED